MNKYRIGTDVPFQLSVDDGVEYLDLSNCTILNVAMYCDAQEAFAGSCTWELNAADHTRLDCVYPGNRQVYTGIMRAVVVMEGADGRKKAYDLADIFEIVATTEEANATEDTVTSATLSAWQLPMSTLSTIVEAAINATEAANGSVISEISYTASTEDEGDNVLHIEQADGTEFDFNVRNGSQGSQGIQGETGPQGPQGLQGNTGSSVDYPFELVNNLTTDDATKALTAAMGVQLAGEITELGQEVDAANIKAEEGATLTEQSQTEIQSLQINSSNTAFASTSNAALRTHYISVAAGDVVRLIASDSGARMMKYGFSTDTPAAGVAVIGGVRLEQESINVRLVSPVTGYFSYYCNNAYFANAKVYTGTPTALGARVVRLESSFESLPTDYVKRDSSRQYLTESQKSAIQYNIGIDEGTDLVRKNIGNIDIGEYVNADGILTPLANTANIKIPIDGSKGFFFIRVFGVYYNTGYTFRFYDASDNHIAYTPTNATNGKLNGLYIIPIPVSTSYIRLNVEPGKENLVQVFQDLPVPDFDKLTDKELITDKDGQISIGYVNVTNGTVAVNNNLKSTIPIPCADGDTFRVSNWNGSYSTDSFASGVGCFLDADMNYLSTFYADTEVYDVVAPEGARYAVFTYAINEGSLISVKRLTTSSSVKILSTGVLKNPMWNGKIWVGFGASMVAQSSSYVGLKWSPMVEAATGLVFKNCGIGGTPLAGDYTNAFWKRIQPVIDYNPDVVTILGGYNDLFYDVPLGTSDEFDKAVADKDCETFLGAYSYIIETLLNWKKALRIVLMTPSYAHTNGADHTPGIGLTYKDYADATIQVAEYYCLPVIDLYRNMGINKLTQGTTYTRGDKIHWNARASQIAASLVIAKLEEINNAAPVE